MAIGITNLGNSTGTTEQAPDIRNLTDATSYTIASWDPPDSGIVLLCIINGQNTVTDTTIDSLTGNGDVWTQIHTFEFDGVRRRLTIYAAYGSALTTGVTTIDFGTDTQLCCYVSIFQITGADESGTAAQAFGLVEDEKLNTAETSAVFNWAGSPQDGNSRPLYWFAHVANEVVTVPGSLTTIDDMNGAGPALGVVTAWQSNGFTDPSDSFTWTTGAAWGSIGVEILAAEEGPAEPTILNIAGHYIAWP